MLCVSSLKDARQNAALQALQNGAPKLKFVGRCIYAFLLQDLCCVSYADWRDDDSVTCVCVCVAWTTVCACVNLRYFPEPALEAQPRAGIMPVGRRKGGLQHRLKLSLWRHSGLLLALLFHVSTAPACAQFESWSGSGSGSGSGLSSILGSAEGSGEDDDLDFGSGSGEHDMHDAWKLRSSMRV